jgi:hypothetical protein
MLSRCSNSSCAITSRRAFRAVASCFVVSSSVARVLARQPSCSVRDTLDTKTGSTRKGHCAPLKLARGIRKPSFQLLTLFEQQHAELTSLQTQNDTLSVNRRDKQRRDRIQTHAADWHQSHILSKRIGLRDMQQQRRRGETQSATRRQALLAREEGVTDVAGRPTTHTGRRGAHHLQVLHCVRPRLAARSKGGKHRRGRPDGVHEDTSQTGPGLTFGPNAVWSAVGGRLVVSVRATSTPRHNHVAPLPVLWHCGRHDRHRTRCLNGGGAHRCACHRDRRAAAAPSVVRPRDSEERLCAREVAEERTVTLRCGSACSAALRAASVSHPCGAVLVVSPRVLPSLLACQAQRRGPRSRCPQYPL